MEMNSTQTRNAGSTAAGDNRREDLRDSTMMAHLLDALEQGTDIGHYGRLTFAMIARHFMAEDELVNLLAKQPDQDETQARTLLLQVQQKDYNPPKREKILDWQAQQEFPIIPDVEDPNCGNVYSELKFPDGIYEHIQEYYEERAVAQAA
jgi:DNA primase large subunit